MSDVDRQLLGTEWIKVAAKHHGQKARIDKIGPRGPRMFLIGLPDDHRHSEPQQKYMRLDWWELGNNWQPLRKGDEVLYTRWQLDVAQEAEAREKERLNSYIESDNTIVADNLPKMIVCTSIYHRPLKTAVSEDQVYYTRNNRAICFACKEKRDNYNVVRAAKLKAAVIVDQTSVDNYVPPKLEILPVEELPLWKITVVQPTVHQVRAKDFLEAAAQVSELGEIVKIERL